MQDNLSLVNFVLEALRKRYFPKFRRTRYYNLLDWEDIKQQARLYALSGIREGNVEAEKLYDYVRCKIRKYIIRQIKYLARFFLVGNVDEIPWEKYLVGNSADNLTTTRADFLDNLSEYYLPTLTQEELLILELRRRGCNTQEIANALNKSKRTVERMIASLKEKYQSVLADVEEEN